MVIFYYSIFIEYYEIHVLYIYCSMYIYLYLTYEQNDKYDQCISNCNLQFLNDFYIFSAMDICCIL